jgi:hypothetical protein
MSLAQEPDTDRWIDLPTQGAPGPREGHAAVWTGSELLVWGGLGPGGMLGDGARYSLAMKHLDSYGE